MVERPMKHGILMDSYHLPGAGFTSRPEAVAIHCGRGLAGGGFSVSAVVEVPQILGKLHVDVLAMSLSLD